MGWSLYKHWLVSIIMENGMKCIEFCGFRKVTISGRQPCVTIPLEIWRKSKIPKGKTVLVEMKITPISVKDLLNGQLKK